MPKMKMEIIAARGFVQSRRIKLHKMALWAPVLAANQRDPFQELFSVFIDTHFHFPAADSCSDSEEFCNGALEPDTEYYLALRAYATDELFTDTPFSDPIKTS